jgi:hypothetical protein
MNDWVSDIGKEFEGKVEYQVGFAPARAQTTTGATTTE